EYRQSMDRGRILFTVTGCAACHSEPLARKLQPENEEREPLKPEESIYSAGSTGPAAKYGLGAIGSKYRPDTLAVYLQNPLKTNPAGRMPNMNLNGTEATDLARYLCRTTDEALDPGMPSIGLKPALIAAEVFAEFGSQPGEYAAFKKLPTDSQWLDLGRRLLVTKGCVNCHAVEASGKALEPLARFPTFDETRKASSKGCLSQPAHPGLAPEYRLTRTEALAVSAFLKDGLSGAGSPAPTHAARVALRRFNCLNCHSKDG